MSRFVKGLMALCALVLIAGLAYAAAGDHVTRLGPGQSYKGPDGREAFNGKNSVGEVIVTESTDDGRVIKVTVKFPKGTGGDAKKFKKGDEINVDGGKAKLKDDDNAKVNISNDGTADCTNCDNDKFKFDGSGTLTGPGGGNNNNDVDLNSHAGAVVTNFEGTGNVFHN